MARTKQSSRGPNPLATGAVGAATGAVVGVATGVLMSNKKARQKVIAGFEEVKIYAQEAMSNMGNGVNMNPKLAKVGIKGGASKIKRKVSRTLKQSNRK
ncbi:MAG TPA: hypothetical protein VKC89_02200 [Patescibacteria group bacterium]|nr:hypothetical protein [Patescibacteria group bacterium]